MQPAVCLCLTGRTIAEDLAVLDLYRGEVDMVELRADYLDPEQQFHIRSFPERAGLPAILTVRRRVDGGRFVEGEAVRLVTIAKGLAFARTDSTANFAYVDLETDFHVPAIEEAARVFGTRIIRSRHFPEGVPADLEAAWNEVVEDPHEIPKLAFGCAGAMELARVISWSSELPAGKERIIAGMGIYGFPLRLLAARTGSILSYSSPIKAGMPIAAPGQVDPEDLLGFYRFRDIGPGTALYALTGGVQVVNSSSPALHNAAFAATGVDAACLPFPAEDPASFLVAAEAAGLSGASVTFPHKESILPLLDGLSPEARDIGAINTIVRAEAGWVGHSTDAAGFRRAVLEFLERDGLEGCRATLVGAGGAARAIARALSELGVAALVLNRNGARAKALARKYGFAWAVCDERALDLVADHADLVINATSVGMEGGDPGDPLDWYDFVGREAVFDVIYKPERTALLMRAKAAGCRISNGWSMLRYQAAEQYRIWMGAEPPSASYE
jgi:3-dehydroquinate dehydratase/shikimate dehydrogenase